MKAFAECFARVWVASYGCAWLPISGEYAAGAKPAIPTTPKALRDTAAAYLRAADYAEKVRNARS